MGFWTRLWRTFSPDRHEAEIDEELQFHLAMKVRNGEASRDDRVRFGNLTRVREETRSANIVEWVESLLRDIRYGLRQLRASPGATAAILVSLGLGIGANTAIFSIVDAALLKSLPVENPRSLRLIEWSAAGWPDPLCQSHTGDTTGSADSEMRGSSVSARMYRQLARQQDAFSSLIGFADADDVAVVVSGHPAEQVRLSFTSVNFFAALGVNPPLGRAFAADDDRPGGEPVVVVSHRFWLRQLGGRADALGLVLRVNNVPARVIGVAPPGFFGLQIGNWVDVYAPLAAQTALSARAGDREWFGEGDTYWWVRQMGRLKPGVSQEAAASRISMLFQRSVVPDGVDLAPSKIPRLMAAPGSHGFDPMAGDDTRALWILTLLVGLVLLVVCANVGNLLLARAVARHREAAVRLALGAGRARILRQGLIESLLLALGGGVLGVALGRLLAETIHSIIRTNVNIGGFDLRLDGRMLGFTCAVCVFTAVLFGIAPALRMSRADINDELKSHNRSVLAGGAHLSRILVVVQIGLSLTVLTAAGLLSRSLANLKSLDVGFDRNNILYVSVNPWRAGYRAEQVEPYVERLRAELESLPGVTHVATISTRPFAGGNGTILNIPGRPFRADLSSGVAVNSVGPGLFETLGIHVVAGRTFEARDKGRKPEPALIDELLARQFFPNRNPLGARFGAGPKQNDTYEVTGIVAPTTSGRLREGKRPMLYTFLEPERDAGRSVHFALRAAIHSQRLAAEVRKRAAAVDANVPVIEVETQDALIDRTLLTNRLLGIFSTSFAAVTLLLAAVGLGGLLAYAVARRAGEIGVRMALGATPRNVLRMVLGDSARLIVAGVAIGLPASYGLGQVLRQMLYGLSVGDPLTLAGALAVLIAVAVFAAWIPSWRASRIDPMSALREE